MRGFRFLTFTLLLSLIVPCAARTARAQRQVTLGNATVALTGPWKFHTGDDMAWAQPGFDDSGWGTMDLTPLAGSYDPTLGSSGFVPGWTARGYKGYHGYAWYRLRVDVEDGQTRLALKMPDDFDDAYQVYVNGRLIGQFGRFAAHGVTEYFSEPQGFPLPADFRSGPATVAIRMWMSAFTPLVDPDAGGLHGPPVLGQAAAVRSLLDLDWYAINRSVYGVYFLTAILLLALLVAFGLFWLDRTEPAYLWLGLTCAAMLALGILLIVGDYTTWIDGVSDFLLTDAVLIPATLGLWVIFWATWFRLGGRTQIHRMVWSLVVLLGISIAMLRAPLYGTVVPVHAIVWLSPLTLSLKLLLGALLVWVTVRGIRKDKAEGWLALPAVVLVAIWQYAEQLSVLHVPTTYFPFGIGITLGQIATVISLLIITVLLLRRFLHGQRQREQWKLEIEQARQLQQVLIPEALPAVPGFTLESEYRPAQQVGGDFFQIIAHPTDGSVLIVLGDVSGHGLEAAMLVSLIVGTIRTLAKFTRDPMEILQGLNERLCGRLSGHFATCVTAHIAANGATAIANAGHLAPYLNGEEIAIAGSLPLGLAEAAEFERVELPLQENDRLVFLTDGVIEAQNADKELFGFDRAGTLMQQQKTATEIASIAQAFGQEDDITVVRIARIAVAEPVAV